MVSDWNEQLKTDGKATCPHEVNFYLKIIDLIEKRSLKISACCPINGKLFCFSFKFLVIEHNLLMQLFLTIVKKQLIGRFSAWA